MIQREKRLLRHKAYIPIIQHSNVPLGPGPQCRIPPTPHTKGQSPPTCNKKAQHGRNRVPWSDGRKEVLGRVGVMRREWAMRKEGL